MINTFVLSIAKTINETIIDPCKYNPCGEHATCTLNSKQKVECQCKDNFIGNPPFCKPECMRNSDCKLDKACVTNKCKDPCTNNCGLNTDCKVVNHRPICACLQGYTGDPFVSCNPLPITGNFGLVGDWFKVETVFGSGVVVVEYE